MWLEVELDAGDQGLRVSARGSRGERPPARELLPEEGLDALQAFASKVGRAVRGGKPLDPAALGDAQRLYGELIDGDLRDVLVRLGEAAKESRLLVRLFARERALQVIPWEALCRPGTSEGFWGTDPRLLLARGVDSAEPWEPREVRGAVRMLAIAPGAHEQALAALRAALGASIESGEIEWLDPIAGPDVSPRVLFDRLRRGKTPHIVHFLGHGGVDASGKPMLRMADDEEGEEVWITAEALGRELSASFYEELRLVVLEACEGAKTGAFGSAAEVLGKAGADAVVAHLWPVKADVARVCSTEIYRALTGADRTAGDIGAAVAAARRTLLATSAEAFSPVLYLRGSDSVIFNFAGRRVSKPGAKRGSKRLAPALQGLLEGAFTMIVGDLDDDRAALRKDITSFMQENGDTRVEGLSLSTLTQRCVLRFGQEVLHSLFQQSLTQAQPAELPPLIEALARFVRPGVHVTLLWRPHLERAVAAAHPQRTVYAIQPSMVGSSGKPRVVKRAAGATSWKMEPLLPKRFDLESEIVVLRLYGGYSAEARPIFSPPILTDDDHIHGLLGAEGLRPPTWMQELLGKPRTQSGLFLGLSILDWRHRMFLRWLYDQRPAPKDSLVLLLPDAEPAEVEIWDSGAGLPGAARIAAITEDPAQLAPLLADIDPGEAR
ncbi:CHAT domain-containing protein [Sorangium cellulosum]|uniref:CHAT domain-containing protein n=1 Tax=Sorangium cellulosum TaxID=56 RepID=UPI0011DDD6B7|nr:CHAT domain-containing protein [Sorangium cellulosum]